MQCARCYIVFIAKMAKHIIKYYIIFYIFFIIFNKRIKNQLNYHMTFAIHNNIYIIYYYYITSIYSNVV